MTYEDFTDNPDEEVEEVEEFEPEVRHISYREKLSRARKTKKITVPLTFDGRIAGEAMIDEEGHVTLALNETELGKKIINLFHAQYLNELSLNGVLREAKPVGAPGHQKRRR